MGGHENDTSNHLGVAVDKEDMEAADTAEDSDAEEGDVPCRVPAPARENILELGDILQELAQPRAEAHTS